MEDCQRKCESKSKCTSWKYSGGSPGWKTYKDPLLRSLGPSKRCWLYTGTAIIPKFDWAAK